MTQHSAQDFIDRQRHSAPVVIFASPLTEMDALRRELHARGVAFTEIVLGMGKLEARDRFAALRDMTGHATLPQVFIHGAFAGGAEAALHDPRLLTSRTDTLAIQRLARLLAYAGILPMLLLTLLLFHPPLHAWAGRALSAYAAVILAFVGALHWARIVFGRRVEKKPSQGVALVVSVLPALLAFGTLVDGVPVVSRLCLLLAGFMLLCAYERRLGQYGPAWFLRMRLHLGYGMGLLLAAAVAAMLFAA